MEQSAQVVAEAFMHIIKYFRVVGRFLDQKHKIGFFKVLHPDGADPLFPDIKVVDWNAGHDSYAVRQAEGFLLELVVNVNVIEGLKGEFALVLELVGHGRALS